MGMLKNHEEKQRGINTLVEFKDQLDIIEHCRVGAKDWHLIFDKNDEFWILQEGVPVYRSEDYHVDEAAQLWGLVSLFCEQSHQVEASEMPDDPNRGRECEVSIEFDLTSMDENQKGNLFEISRLLGECGIGFDTGSALNEKGIATRDWEWDWSLHGPVKVHFVRWVDENPKSRYNRDHPDTEEKQGLLDKEQELIEKAAEEGCPTAESAIVNYYEDLPEVGAKITKIGKGTLETDGVVDITFDNGSTISVHTDYHKSESFFDPVTKRGIVKEGPAYFDDSLPSMDQLQQLEEAEAETEKCEICGKEAELIKDGFTGWMICRECDEE